MTREPSFDLIEAPWIPVTAAGVRREVSLREALYSAHEIDGLAVDDPLQAVAVFRQVLLAAVLHALDAPHSIDDWETRYRAGRLDRSKLARYLDEWADRFDLFDPVRPFAQVAELRAGSGETKPVSLIIPQLASGNNVPLFSARTEDEPPSLTPAEAARAVVSAHCWDTAAIKTGAAGDPHVKAGKTTGNPTGPLGQLGIVVPTGRSLFETLMLSVPVLPQGLRQGDHPQWANATPVGPMWSVREPRGLLDLLTWQSRRIRLVPDAGRVDIRRVVVCAGDRMSILPIDVEPHTPWRMVAKPKAGDPPRRPERHQPGRSAWRGLATLVATRQPTSEGKSAPNAVTDAAGLADEQVLPPDLPLQALVVGVVYGNQSAVVEDVVVDTVPLPVTALLDQADNGVRRTLLAVVDQAEELRKAANHLGDDLRAAAGVDKMPWDKGQRLGELLVHALTPTVRRLLAGLQRHPEDAERAEIAWRRAARQIAEGVAAPALDAVPATAFLGRDQEKKHAVRVATAEAAFRRRLNEVLGPAAVPATVS